MKDSKIQDNFTFELFKDMVSFKDIYEFLQSHDEMNITSWLEEPWVGKDKQETLLRLFSGIGLMDKLMLYDICKGNYNKKTIKKYTTLKDVFYDEKNKLINIKDKGDSSDLTGIHKMNEKHLLVTTSKNINKTQVGSLHIDKILTNFQQYGVDGYTMTLCVCVKNSTDFRNMMSNMEESNQQLKLLLEKEDTIIIDWNDLDQAYHRFKMYFGHIPLNNIMKSNKTTLYLKMHQELGMLKTLEIKDNNKKKVLWGHIQRSGKSYIIAGCIINDSKYKSECNYLVITTAPNETMEQQVKVFDCIQLENFNVVVLTGKNKKPNITNKNIIICSKQFLQAKIDVKENKNNDEKTKCILWLKRMVFDMRFIDESHNGGTTELAKKTLDSYGKSSFTVQITATYSKPINDYNIPKDSWILWDLEDIKLCKHIKSESSVDRLVSKHGISIKTVLKKYSPDNIIAEYSKYPELWLLTDEIKSDVVSHIIQKTHNLNYGWSPDACFLLKQATILQDDGNNMILIKDEFQNERENLKLWYRIFGKKDAFGIPHKDFPDEVVFMKRIEKICKNPTIDSRFIGEGDFQNEPMIIMAFLPQHNIDKISKATTKLLQKNKVIPDYEIVSINCSTTNNPLNTIQDYRNKARNSGKKGVLVLSGKQCSLGVSIENCDIVLLLNNNMSYDMIYQMMFRCMTEGKGKKCGFVVDLNIHRVVDTSVINYASLIKPDVHPIIATKFILQERLINLNSDHWMPSFGNDVSKITALCKNVYEIYSSNTEKALQEFLNRLRFKEVLLTQEEQTIFSAMFNNTKITKDHKELVDRLLEDDENIKKGIEKTKVITKDTIDIQTEIQSNENADKQINYMDILKHIIPLICLFTIHNKESSFVEMFELIRNDDNVYKLLIDQTNSWWGKSIDSKILQHFIKIYIKYVKDDTITNQIIRTIKELFIKNIKNSRELSNLIDKYLIPQELEKKGNAEVCTPFILRHEMLDKIPLHFWTSFKKVFEPCTGKGGFLLDIIDKFMNGLEKVIPDEKDRYKTILEDCLYFSDINPTNIFICKLLIDPYNEYELNYHEGNTLKLNISEKWDICGFDAVIGNPPYESQNATGDNKLYLDFTKYAINNLHEQGILLFITPTTIIDYIIEMDKNRNCLDKFYDIKYIALNTPEKHFNVGSTFTYFMLIKQDYTCETTIEHFQGIDVITLKKGMKIPKIPSKIDLSIIDKICSKTECYEVKKCKFINNTQRIRKEHITKQIVSPIKTDKHRYKIYDTINKTNPNGKYYYYDKLDNDSGKKRIIFSNKGYLMPFVTDSQDETYSDNFSYVLYEKNLLELFNSNIIKYLIHQFSKNGFDRINCIKMIKKVKLKDDIYQSFDLNKAEIKVIESLI